MINPYSGYGNIVLGERLVGRERHIDAMLKRLASNGGSLSVVGEPRIGKSSLAKEVCRQLSSTYPERPIVWLDASTITSETELFVSLIDEVTDALEVNGPGVSDSLSQFAAMQVSNAYDAYRRCRKGLQSLNTQGIQPIVVLDEFDAIRQYENAAALTRRLRELIYHNYDTGLSCVLISRRSLANIESQLADVSNLDGVCEQIYLGPLNIEATLALARRGFDTWSFECSDYKLLWWFTGGHPYLAEMVLCLAHDMGNVADATNIVAANVFEFYERLRNILEEDNLFDQLVQLTVGPAWSLKSGSPDKLLRYGVIHKQEDNEFRGWSEHFQLYLEHCARETPSWEMWKETELALRNFIECVCQEHFGNDWLEVLTKRHKAVASLKEQCQKNMEKERRCFGPSASGRILEYTYPNQLWELISAEWAVFGPLLGKDKSYWCERFNQLSKVRTPTAHNRIVPDHEIVIAEGYCKELRARLTEVSLRGESVEAK